MTQPAPHQTGLLMRLIVALLAPVFLGVAGGDVDMARLAAMETVNAYRARNNVDLIAIAQIIAFGLAALGSLSLSMDDDISVNMALRLRANANACNRSAEQNRRALAQSQAAAPEPEPAPAEDDPLPGPTLLFSLAAAQNLAAEAEARHQAAEPMPAPDSQSSGKRQNEMWAIAMVSEASEITANLPSLPPAERREAELRAAVLSAKANRLLTGENPPLQL